MGHLYKSLKHTRQFNTGNGGEQEPEKCSVLFWWEIRLGPLLAVMCLHFGKLRSINEVSICASTPCEPNFQASDCKQPDSDTLSILGSCCYWEWIFLIWFYNALKSDFEHSPIAHNFCSQEAANQKDYGFEVEELKWPIWEKSMNYGGTARFSIRLTKLYLE